MTLSQLECTYNFHDCDVFTPFEINCDSITVIFDLAKHLQYDDLKSRYGDSLKNKECNLIVRAKFSNYLDLSVSEWQYRTSETQKKCNERAMTIEEFDSDADFISLSILDGTKINFRFERLEKNKKSRKLSEIQFVCHNIDIIEEKIYNASEYDKLWEEFK